MVIYLDVLIGINFIMNLAILYLVKLILKLKSKRFRFILAAILGNLFLLDVLFSNGGFSNTIPGKIVASLLMLTTAFYPMTFGEFFRALSLFYFVSFMIGGGSFALFYLMSTDSAFKQELLVNNIYVPWWILLVSLSFLFGFFRLVWATVSRKFLTHSLVVPVTVYVAGEKLNMRAFIDTGNGLKDPVSGNPVMVVEYSAVEPLLPEKLRPCFKGEVLENLEELERSVLNSPWETRIRFIPFASIGRNNSVMAGIKADRVCMWLEGRLYETDNVVLGICTGPLSPDGEYEALLSTEFFVG